MTTFTRTWDAAYEANPANTQDISQGAARIRETKTDTQERGEVDHSWGGDVDDGTHKKVTFVDPLGAKPTQANDETYLYAKDVSATSELFYEDEAGNETQITNAGASLLSQAYPIGAIYLSTVSTTPATLFGGTWSAITDGLMLVQQGTITAGDTGGSADAIVVSHTHGAGSFATDTEPNHTHTVPNEDNLGGDHGMAEDANLFGTTTTSAAGAHSHSITGTSASSGSSGTGANLPPYLAVYMWKRTA